MVMAACSLTCLKYFAMPVVFREFFPDLGCHRGLYHLYSLLWWCAFAILLYLVIPALWLKLSGEKLSDYGFCRPQGKSLWSIVAVLLAAMIGPVWLASHLPSFLQTYPFYSYALYAPTRWMVFEAAYLAQFVALEFFFRGFLLFSLEKKMGSAAIFVAMLPYCMVHFGKPLPEVFGAVVAGIVLGWLAWRSRSIVGGLALHWSVALSMDLLALWQKGWFMPNADWNLF